MIKVLMLFGPLLLLILFGTPIAVSLTLVSAGWFVFTGNADKLIQIAQMAYAGYTSFVFMAIPFFIVAGNLMAEGEITSTLSDLVYVFIGKVKGSLAIMVTLVSMLFGAVSGSGPATSACIGGALAPEMKKEGYDPQFIASTVGLSGPLGILIPPSIQAIVLAGITEYSVGSYFLATIIPAFIFGFIIIAYSIYISKKRNYGSKAIEKYIQTTKEASFGIRLYKAFVKAIPILMIPIIILGGIFSGIFTPTEAAVVAVNYAIVLNIIRKKMTFKRLITIVKSASISAGAILLTIGSVMAFRWISAYEGIPKIIANAIVSAGGGTIMFILLTQVTFFIGGMLISGSGELLLLMPILYPIAMELGIDPLYYGGIVLANTAIGMITPPYAATMFVSSRVCEVPFDETIKEALPVVGFLVAALIVVTFIPWITTFIPRALGF